MPQNIASKQLGFAGRLATATVAILDQADEIASLKAEWDANAYATGAQPTAQNLTDDLLQGGGLAYLTALQVNVAEATLVDFLAFVAANRGKLEAMRP